MADFETEMLTKARVFDFKRITIFLFSKFDQLFFLPSKSNGLSSLSLAKRQITYTVKDYETVIYVSCNELQHFFALLLTKI